jgi:hypothetical protein
MIRTRQAQPVGVVETDAAGTVSSRTAGGQDQAVADTAFTGSAAGPTPNRTAANTRSDTAR